MVAVDVACARAQSPLSWTAMRLGCNLSSLKEQATHSKLERKSIAKKVSRKHYNEKSAETGTV